MQLQLSTACKKIIRQLVLSTHDNAEGTMSVECEQTCSHCQP